MAQPNVVREPSMDEILASIRRIIESNEPPVGAPGMLAAQDEGAVDSLDDEAIVADFQAEEARRVIELDVDDDVVASPAVQADVRGQPAMSLADVAARVRAASERNGMSAREASVRHEPHIEETAPKSANPLTTARMAPASAAGLQGDTSIDADQRDSFREAVTPSRQTPPPSAAVSLVSATVGAQVASSFGALAEAVEAGPRRSFDEIAEDMLRPMLQEWLDDNLPTLVERLVREEIERVARGPRR